MALLYTAIVEQYKYLMYDLAVPKSNESIFIETPWLLLSIATIYAVSVLKVVPEFMSTRKPFEIKPVMIIYNIVQVLVNTYLFIGVINYHWLTENATFLCQKMENPNTPRAEMMVFVALVYFYSRLLDLFDTLFMTLRKKSAQVSFLHVYHHIIILVAAWIGVKYVPGGNTLVFPTLNVFVHMIMYSYYMVTVINPEFKKNLFFKKRLTELQLVQFMISILHATIISFMKDCNFPKEILLLFIPQGIFMVALFSDFYKKSYLKKKSEINNNNNNNKPTLKTNSNSNKNIKDFDKDK